MHEFDVYTYYVIQMQFIISIYKHVDIIHFIMTTCLSILRLLNNTNSYNQ